MFSTSDLSSALAYSPSTNSNSQITLYDNNQQIDQLNIGGGDLVAGPSSNQIEYVQVPYTGLTQEAANFGTLKTSAYSRLIDTIESTEVSSFSEASFLDFITVTSNTLPVNTPITLQFNAQLEGNLEYVNFGAPPPGGDSQAQVSEDFTINGGESYFITDEAAANPHQPILDQSVAYYNTKVGQTVQFIANLEAVATSDSDLGALQPPDSPTGPPAGTTIAESDYYDTANFYATSLTSGVTLSSASGHDYAIPAAVAVPEPNSLALLGVGTLGLMAPVLRARRRQA